MNYKIDTKQSKVANKMDFDTEDDVIYSIKLFDLIPPFKVLNENKEDCTEMFLEMLKKEGYAFVDKNQVAKLLPKELIQIMNNNYRKAVMVTLPKELNIKLVHEEDIKSIVGFYELWEKKAITIGHINKNPVFYDTTDKKIYCINKLFINEYGKKEILYESVQDFLGACHLKGLPN